MLRSSVRGTTRGRGVYHGRTFTRSSNSSHSATTRHYGRDSSGDGVRSRTRTVIGTDSVFSGSLRTAVTKNKRPSGPGVFVSRLHPETKTNELVVHIRNKTGLRVEVQQTTENPPVCESFYLNLNFTSF